MNNKILKHALIGAGITAGWIVIVVTIIFNGERLIGQRIPEENILIPISMLILFVTSAAVTGFGVFGQPVMWYLDGRKKEALKLLGVTLGILAIIGISCIILLLAVFS